MASENLASYAGMTPAEVALRTGRDSYGVVRVLNSSAGTPGAEREYEAGDEALVENGLAEWVIAPVHLPSAGRRLDGDAEREATPLGGIEAFPPATSYDHERDAEARREGYVTAFTDEGLGERMASKRASVARDLANEDDVKSNAALGSLGARSGPVTSRSDLPADKALAEASATGDTSAPDKGARAGGSAPKGAGK